MPPSTADSLQSVASAIHALGTGNAATQMGGLEAHAVLLKEGLDELANSLSEIALAIDRLADALGNQG